jgi:hypothetical protein
MTDALKLAAWLGEVVISTLVGFATWLGLFDNEKGYTDAPAYYIHSATRSGHMMLIIHVP